MGPQWLLNHFFRPEKSRLIYKGLLSNLHKNSVQYLLKVNLLQRDVYSALRVKDYG